MAVDTQEGLFLRTTDEVEKVDIARLTADQNLKDILLKISQRTNEVALAVNLKRTGIYHEPEFVNGNVWYANKSLSSLTADAPQPRQEFTTTVIYGALKNSAGNKQVAHGIQIDANTRIKRAYTVANDPALGSYKPLPYASTTAAEVIEFWIDATYINITVGKDQSAYACDVVIEYIKE